MCGVFTGWPEVQHSIAFRLAGTKKGTDLFSGSITGEK
jgi:hypothetical protein